MSGFSILFKTVAAMIKAFRNIAVGLLVALGLALPASATTTASTDFTDLWWGGTSENGWGLNLIHQNTTIVATLYVYSADGSPRFFLASASGTNSFSGQLFETRGTYYGTVPYNPNFTSAAVGTLTLTFNSATTGTLQYNVGNVTVTKPITRFLFANNNLTGSYLGGATVSSVCSGVAQNSLMFDTLRVTHNGASITMTVDFYNAASVSSRCTFSGTYSQAGSLGSVSGTYACTFGTTPGNQGNFTITEIAPHQSGFNGRFTGSDQICSSHIGYFGGLRDVQ